MPGLRREELAQLAGVSATYYTTLEQGQGANASESVIDAIASALQLGEDERVHLHNLARPAKAKRRRPARPEVARPAMVQLITAMREVPALTVSARGVATWTTNGSSAWPEPATGHGPASRPWKRGIAPWGTVAP